MPVWRQCSAPLVQAVTGDPGGGLAGWLGGGLRTAEPVLSAVVTSLLSRIAPGVATGHQRWFLALWVLLTAAVLAGLVVAVGTVRRHPHADPVALALSPVLALTLYRSTDLLPLALAVVALWAWSRDRERLAGVLGGLALLAGPLSAVVLLAMLLLPGPWRRRRPTPPGGHHRRSPSPRSPCRWPWWMPVRSPSRGGAWREGRRRPRVAWYLFTLAGFPIGAGYVAVIAGARCGAHRRRSWCSAPAPAAPGGGGRRPGRAVRRAAAPPRRSSRGRRCGWCPSSRWSASAGATTWSGPAPRPCTPSRCSATSTTSSTPAHGLPPGWYAAALLLRLAAVVWLAREAWVSASWGDAAAAGTLWKLPSARPVENSTGGVGSNAYPPVTERP